MPPELITLYNNLIAKDPSIVGGLTPEEFAGGLPTRADLDIFLGDIERYHPDVLQKYQTNKVQEVPTLIQEDPLQSQMRRNLAPPKTTKQTRSELLDSIYPVDTTIATQEKQARQAEIDRRREIEKQTRTDLLFSSNPMSQAAGAAQFVGSLFDRSAQEDIEAAITTLGEDQTVPTADLTPDLVKNFSDSKAAEQARRNSELLKSNKELLQQGKGLSTDIWTNLPAKRIHELQTQHNITLDQIMNAPEIEGYTPEQLLEMKELIGAEQVSNARAEYDKLNAFDKVLAKREEKVEYIKQDLLRLQELSALGEQATPQQLEEAQSIATSLQADPMYKEYVDILDRQTYSQEARNEIDTKYPHIKQIDNLNKELQAKKNEEYSNNIWMKRGLGAVFSGPVLAYNTLATLPSYLTSTLDAELAAGGNEAAQTRLALRAQSNKRDGVSRDAEVATRPIQEKVSEFADANGKMYTMSFSEDGRALDIYDETGNPAQISDAQKLEWLQWGEESPLKVTAKRKWNSDAVVNQVQDLTTDIAGTMALMYATRGLGAGAIADRVRTSMSIYGQYMGRFAEEGIAEGLSPKDAVNRARLLTAVEAGTEAMFNVFGKVMDPLKLKGSKDALERVLAEGNPTRIKEVATRELRKTLAGGMAGEPTEEVIAELVNPFVNALYNDTEGTDFDQEMPSGLDLATAAGLGFIGAVGPTLAAASRVNSDVRSDQFYKESIYALVKDPSRTRQAMELVGQGTEILPVIESAANMARVDLADRSLTEQQKIDRVSAIFNSEIAKQRQGELLGTPREGEADALVSETDKELQAAYAQQDVVDAISGAVVENKPQEGTDSTVTEENVNPSIVYRGSKYTTPRPEEVAPSGYYPGTYYFSGDDAPIRAREFGDNITEADVSNSNLYEIEPDSADSLKAEAAKAGFSVFPGSGNGEVEYLKSKGFDGIKRGSEVILFAPPAPTSRPLTTATPKTVQGYSDIIKATMPQLEPQQVQDLAIIAQAQVGAAMRDFGLTEQQAWEKIKGRITTDFSRLQGEVLRQSPVSQQYNEGEIDENELLQNLRSQPNLPTEVQELVPVLEQALSSGDNITATGVAGEIADILAANETSVPTSVFPTPELEQQFKTQVNETIQQQIRNRTESEGTQANGRGQEASSLLRGVHQTARSLGLESPRELEEIALREWAVANGVWTEDVEAELGDRFLDRGIESRVYVGPDGTTVIKGNDGKSYASWAEALEGFRLSSLAFPDVALTVLGFGIVTDINGNKVFGVVLEQPRVNKARVAEVAEIEADMAKRGYEKDGNNDWYNPENLLFIHDLHQKNVVVDVDGNLRYIDTRVYDSESEIDINGYYQNEGIQTEQVRSGTEQESIGNSGDGQTESNNIGGSEETGGFRRLGVPTAGEQTQTGDTRGAEGTTNETTPILRQDDRGAATRTGTYFSNQADVSTPIHEDHHHFLDLIDELAAEGNEKALEQKATIDEFALSDEGKKFWARKRAAGVEWARGRMNRNNPVFRQELFAESAEKYFSEGKRAGFSEKMNEMFERFKVWLQDIYKNLLDSPMAIELSPKMRSLFDSIYGEQQVTTEVNQHNRKVDSNIGVNEYVWAPVTVDDGTGVPPAPQAPDRATVLQRLREKKAAGEFTTAEEVFNANPEGYEYIGFDIHTLGIELNLGKEDMSPLGTKRVPEQPTDETDIETIFLKRFIEFNWEVQQANTAIGAMAEVQAARGDELPKEFYERPVADYLATADKLNDLIVETFDTLEDDRANEFFARELQLRGPSDTGYGRMPLSVKRMIVELFLNRPSRMRPQFRPLLNIIQNELSLESGRTQGAAYVIRMALSGDDTITPQDKKLARSLLDARDFKKLTDAEWALKELEAMDASDDVLLEMDSPTSLSITIDSELTPQENVAVDAALLGHYKALLEEAMTRKYGDNYMKAMIDIINETAKKC